MYFSIPFATTSNYLPLCYCSVSQSAPLFPSPPSFLSFFCSCSYLPCSHVPLFPFLFLYLLYLQVLFRLYLTLFHSILFTSFWPCFQVPAFHVDPICVIQLLDVGNPLQELGLLPLLHDVFPQHDNQVSEKGQRHACWLPDFHDWNWVHPLLLQVWFAWSILIQVYYRPALVLHLRTMKLLPRKVTHDLLSPAHITVCLSVLPDIRLPAGDASLSGPLPDAPSISLFQES